MTMSMNQTTNSQSNQALILASNSPRRRQLLGLVVGSFRVQPADVDESLLPRESPQEYVLRLAEDKARAVGEGVNGRSIIVAADTTVVDDGEILGKPAHAEEAGRILRRLRGRTHQVLTGLAVFHPLDKLLVTKLIATDVPMRNYSDQEIEDYIASGDPYDKAGAYAVQNEAFHPVSNLGGCFANVMGFPICHFMLALEELMVYPQITFAPGTRFLRGTVFLGNREEVPLKCQETLGYSCPVFEQVLKVKRDA